ncbi:MAG: NADPH-dependent FMN reductase, partial [Pseudorhodobacter sp.]|nr:NADPH-dependent FMN reductase [Rhizobacter sp.]
MTSTVKKRGMDIRVGQAPAILTRAEFRERFNNRYYDPAYVVEKDAIARLEEIAWQALQEGRKAPVTQPSGADFADPTYPMSVQWMQTRQRLRAAEKTWKDSATKSRVLLI